MGPDSAQPRRIRIARAACRLAALAAIAACAAVRAASPKVEVLDPWVRGTVDGQTATSAYMKLQSDTEVRLVAVACDAAERGSIHEMTTDGNMMRMRTLSWLPVPARGAVELAPGHDHLMLEGLKRVLKAGDTVSLTLTFVDPSTGRRLAVDVRAPVRPLGAP